jgi:hypothetical protein
VGFLDMEICLCFRNLIVYICGVCLMDRASWWP